MKYDFTAIEKKWQQKWLEEKPFTAVTGDKTREKFYGLRPGPARGPCPPLYRYGHHLPEKADGGIQCPVPHRL